MSLSRGQAAHQGFEAPRCLLLASNASCARRESPNEPTQHLPDMNGAIRAPDRQWPLFDWLAGGWRPLAISGVWLQQSLLF